MTIVVLLALLLAGLVFLTVYPYFVYPLLLRLVPERPLAPPDDAAHAYALLFCAHNEAKALPATLANLRKVKAAWPELQIYAYSDNSSDDTFRLLAQASDILTAVEGTERAGKPAGMRKLVDLADEDILIFMDANVLIDPATVRRFEDYFSRSDVGAVACTLTYVDEADTAIAAEVGGLYWRMEEALKQRESLTGSTMGADGSLFAVRRSLYPYVAPDLQDDFLASMQAVFAGLRCVSAPDIAASEKGATSSTDEFRRKRRIACGAFSTHRAMRPLARLGALDRFKYVSHKLVRWFGAFYIAAGVVVAGALAATLGLFVPYLALVLVGAAALGILAALGLGPARSVVEILAAMTATSVGVVESVVGKKYVTWKPTER